MMTAASAGTVLLLPSRAWASDVRPAVIRKRDERGLIAAVVLMPSRSLILGRGQGSDLLIKHAPLHLPAGSPDDARLSRRHLRVRLTSNGAQIEDLGSTNGSRLGRRQLEPGRAVFVPDGAKVNLADTLTVRVSVLRDGKTPKGLVMHKAGDPVRYALVAGAVGLSESADDLLTSLPGAPAAVSLEDRGTSHLRVRGIATSLAVGEHRVAPGEWCEIVRPQSLRIGDRPLEVSALALDELRELAGPDDADETRVISRP